MNCQYGEDESVLGEMAAVAQDLVLDVADALAVDEHASGGDALAAPRGVAVQLEHVAVFEEVAALGGNAHLPGQRDVADEMPVLAVDGDEVPRANEGQDELQLFLGGVALDGHPLIRRP